MVDTYNSSIAKTLQVWAKLALHESCVHHIIPCMSVPYLGSEISMEDSSYVLPTVNVNLLWHYVMDLVCKTVVYRAAVLLTS